MGLPVLAAAAGAAVVTSALAAQVGEGLGALLGLAVGGIAGAALAWPIGRQMNWAAETLERLAAGETDQISRESGISETDRMLRAGRALARRSDEERRSAERQRIEAEALIAAMAEGIVVIAADERVRSINPAARRMLDLGTTPVAGRLAVEVLRNAELNRLLQRVLLSGEPADAYLDFHAPRDFCLQVRGVPFAPLGERRPGALLTLHDVSRLRTLERVRRDFAANASHELRTPVTSIRGYAESLCEMQISPPEAAHFAEVIARNAAQLQTLIQDLLTLAEIESDREQGRTPPKEDLPVSVLFAAVEQACLPAARSRRITLRFRTPEGLRVQAVPSLLERALLNLVENAIRYSDPGTTVDVEAERTPDELLLRVRDQGVGIAPEHLERIFERFYRVDRARSRRHGGTGLGLSIVRNAVEAQGGVVTAESQVGVGSVFTIRLPATPAEPHGARPAPLELHGTRESL